MLSRNLRCNKSLLFRQRYKSINNKNSEYNESINDNLNFWLNKSKDVHWFTAPTISNVLEKSKPPFFTWFKDSMFNMCYNCLDRHIIEGRGEQHALIYDSPLTNSINKITYNELLESVKKFAGVMRALNIQKGDIVLLYLPNIPEALIAMLACTRIGATHCVVFGGFAVNELAKRINDVKPKLIVTCNGGFEGKKLINYKSIVDVALSSVNRTNITKCIVFERKNLNVKSTNLGKYDFDWTDCMNNSKPVDDCIPLQSQHPLYILHTSGSTGHPKGIVRDSGSVAVALKYSMKYVFQTKPGDVFFSTSDIGWVVGHSYILYGPLLNGLTTVLYDGKSVGTPDEANLWRIVERHQVNTMFTAPTALRAIKRIDSDGSLPKQFNLSSLKALFLAGERCDPDTLHWAEKSLKKPILDNWWQTETGWPIASNLINIPIKYGSTGAAVPGYDVCIMDKNGKIMQEKNKLGTIVIRSPLPPGFMSTLHNNDDKFVSSYFEKYPDFYDTGDSGYIDDDDYIYVMSRTDDIINVAGHRLSCGAIEEVISDHIDVAECAVIGIKDELKGQVPIGLVVLNEHKKHSDDIIVNTLMEDIRNRIGAIVCLKKIVVVRQLPKTRSGKILRNTLRSISNGDDYKIPATIDDPDVLTEITKIIKSHQ